MVKKFVLLNKKEGETPLQALSLFRNKHKDYKDLPMTYAGRLDPMASGLLIVLIGEECKNKEKYLKLDKEYEFEILFGFSTDTYDILGKVVSHKSEMWERKDLEKKIKENLKYFTGKFIQKYPIYSSKTVKGKQLFEYGRSGQDVEIPQREVSVQNLKLIKLRKITRVKLLKEIEKRISKVEGDFRQREILKIWRKALSVKHRMFDKNQDFVFVGSFKIKCGSGTYVRGIADGLGSSMSLPALAYKIKRTKIGKYVNL